MGKREGKRRVRSVEELRTMLDEVQTSERINENKRMGAEAALLWALGDETAMGAVL